MVGAVADQASKKDALSVTEALMRAKAALETVSVTIVGEVSEFNDKPGYKAAYFTISDPSSALPCLMWRNRYMASGVELEVGMKVEVRGRFSAYTAKGRMQFTVDVLRPAGEGDLRVKVDRLARKLKAEGLMDPARKKPVPTFATKVAVVTSPRGKAIHDVIRTLRRRNPLVEVGVAGVPVEGAEAPAHLVEGLRAAYSWRPDVILLVRGGGSYEDLMPFNDEKLARAIADCPIPIVTGIGHEPDTSIADMVSDRRASTPTAAAESVAPAIEELEAINDRQRTRLVQSMRSSIDRRRARLDAAADRPALARPDRLIERYRHAVALADDRFHKAIPGALDRDRRTEERLRTGLTDVGGRLLVKHRSAVSLAAGKLESLSPLGVLARGYSVAYEPRSGRIVNTISAVSVGDSLAITVADGEITADVTGTTPNQRILEDDAHEH